MGGAVDRRRDCIRRLQKLKSMPDFYKGRFLNDRPGVGQQALDKDSSTTVHACRAEEQGRLREQRNRPGTEDDLCSSSGSPRSHPASK